MANLLFSVLVVFIFQFNYNPGNLYYSPFISLFPVLTWDPKKLTSWELSHETLLAILVIGKMPRTIWGFLGFLLFKKTQFYRHISMIWDQVIYLFPNYLINYTVTQFLNTFRSQWWTTFLLQLQNYRSHSTDIFSIFGSFGIKIAQFGNAFPFCTRYQLKEKNLINLVYF